MGETSIEDLVRAVARLHTPAHLGGWLATVVTHECQAVRRAAGRTVPTAKLMETTIADPCSGPEQQAIDEDVARRLWRAVAELSESRRALVRALFADGPRPYAEISRTTGLPVGGIGPSRCRALKQLRSAISDRALA